MRTSVLARIKLYPDPVFHLRRTSCHTHSATFGTQHQDAWKLHHQTHLSRHPKTIVDILGMTQIRARSGRSHHPLHGMTAEPAPPLTYRLLYPKHSATQVFPKTLLTDARFGSRGPLPEIGNPNSPLRTDQGHPVIKKRRLHRMRRKKNPRKTHQPRNPGKGIVVVNAHVYHRHSAEDATLRTTGTPVWFYIIYLD